jgi:hypothetical protein
MLSGIKRCVVRMWTGVSEELIITIFKIENHWARNQKEMVSNADFNPENGDDMFLWNVLHIRTTRPYIPDDDKHS